MDHEFGTSFLEPSQQGWDWFSLQLDDGSDLMVFVLRQKQGHADSHSSGTLVGPNGSVTSLASSDFKLIPGRIWHSPSSGARYPVEWRVEIPDSKLSLSVRALIDGQELHTDRSTGVTYWEGAVEVVGTNEDGNVFGQGYLEMTGYVGQPMSDFLR